MSSNKRRAQYSYPATGQICDRLDTHFRSESRPLFFGEVHFPKQRGAPSTKRYTPELRIMAAENGSAPSAEGTTANRPDGVTAAETPAEDSLPALRVVVGGKRVLLALCENDRGRYLKINDGRKKLTVSESGIPNLRECIDGLYAHYKTLPASATASPVELDDAAPRSTKSDLLHAERFIAGGRKYYLDLLQNERGVFVKMSQATSHRTSILFPSNALEHLREALTQIVEMAPEPTPVKLTDGHLTRVLDRQTTVPSGGTVAIKATQRELRIEGKRVVFESGANRRGSYLRITETAGGSKMSVTLPHEALPQVLKLLHEAEEAGDPLDGATEVVAAGSKASEQ